MPKTCIKGDIDDIDYATTAEHPVKTNGTKFKEVFGFQINERLKTPEDLMTWLETEYKEGI